MGEDFHVLMDCYDGTEVCKIISIFLLHLLDDIIAQENLGLYRDDGLGIFKNVFGPKMKRKKKDIQKRYLKIMNLTLP